MTAEEEQLLAEYRARAECERPRHPVVTEAAADSRLSTPFLLPLALEEARVDWEDCHPHCPVTEVLRERRTAEVAEAARALLADPLPHARELAAILLLLRIEEPPGDDAWGGADVAGWLHAAVESERDSRIAFAMLSALASHLRRADLPLLLACCASDDSVLRWAAQDHLLPFVVAFPDLADTILDALVAFAIDPDRDLRWSAWYDVAEWPEYYAPRRTTLLEHLDAALHDADLEVREQAARAAEWLRTSDPRPGARRPRA